MAKKNENTAVAELKQAVAVEAIESRRTYTKNTREEAEANGCGLNTFGSWVGQNNILASLVRFIALNYALICEAISDMDGALVAHVTQGCKGAHVGLCMMFENVTFTAFDGSQQTRTVYLKDNGAMYVAGLCEGFSILSESELRLQAVKLNDVRKVRLDTLETDAKTKVSAWKDGEVVDAAMLGALNGRYQGLLFRDSSGVRVITRIFGETKEHETARAVSVVTLAGEAKENAKRWIFDGIAEAKATLKAKGKTAAKGKVAAKATK